MSKSQSNNTQSNNLIVFIAIFTVIGLMLGFNTGQVYSGTSTVGSDTIELTNDGNLDTRVSNFSLTPDDSLTTPGTGGTITTDGDYTVHTFTSSGTFVSPCALNVECLVVAGGGGGGSEEGGGGGAGGLLYSSSFPILSTSYSITIGSGGIGGVESNTRGTNGMNSVFSSLTSDGGGGGGTNAQKDGFDGGSGGGSGNFGEGVGGTGTAGQGNDGGVTVSARRGGGGGGSGAVGVSGDSTGNGGVGLQYDISGTLLYYAGGGGAGSQTTGGSGGLGGGGGEGVVGTENTGGGGGGGSISSSGKDGGSGIVIIRYPTPLYNAVNPVLSSGSDEISYTGTLYSASNFEFMEGSSYIDTVDVSGDVSGEFSVIPVGASKNITVDTGLDYSIEYIPKNMDVSLPSVFAPGNDFVITTSLVDTDNVLISSQPAEMRVRLFNNGNQIFEEIVESTSYTVSGSYLNAEETYQLRLAYNGYEFGGWSNENLVNFCIGQDDSVAVNYVISPLVETDDSVLSSVTETSNEMVGLAVTGWLAVPIIGDIIRWIADILGVVL